MALDRTPLFNRANVTEIKTAIAQSNRKQRQKDKNEDGGNGSVVLNRALLTFPDPSNFNLIHELTESRDKYRGSSRDGDPWINISSTPRYITHSMSQISAAFLKPPGQHTIYSAAIDNGLRWIVEQDESKQLINIRNLWVTSGEGNLLDKYIASILCDVLDTQKVDTVNGSKQTVVLPYYIHERLNTYSKSMGYSLQGLAKICCMVTLKGQAGDINEDFADEMQEVVKGFMYSMKLRARVGKVILDEFGVTDDE